MADKDFFAHETSVREGPAGFTLDSLRNENVGEFLSPEAIPQSAVQNVRVVSFLPQNATVGDEVYFKVSQADKGGAYAGLYWHLIYDPARRVAFGGDYPWAVLSAPALADDDETDVTTNSLALVDLNGGRPRVALPLKGVYECVFGVEAYEATTANQTLFHNISFGPVGGAAWTIITGQDIFLAVVNTSGGGQSRSITVGVSATGYEIRQRYTILLAGNGHWRKRFLKCTPVRVG